MITIKNRYVHPKHVKNFKAKEEEIIFALDSMNENSLSVVYNALLSFKCKDVLMKKVGICTNLDTQVELILEEFQYKRQVSTLMTLWKHYSGSRAYPVPSPSGSEREHHGQIYYAAKRSNSMWSKTKRYGRLRHSLLNFLIACFYLVLEERAFHMTTEIRFED